ncbi:MAG: cyclic nucleotide-binding domain-containing protein [Candidatus Gastranaerophilaceae bacterium]|jgi:CRP-like cAMP-binding protein
MTKNNILQLINTVPFFYDLSEKDLTVLAEFFKIRELQEGRYVFKQGDKPDGLYFIIEGKVKVLKKIEETSEIILEMHEPPCMFGEMAFIDGARRAASVVTLEKFKGLTLSNGDFKTIIENYPLVAINIIRKIAHSIDLKLRIESNDQKGLI